MMRRNKYISIKRMNAERLFPLTIELRVYVARTLLWSYLTGALLTSRQHTCYSDRPAGPPTDRPSVYAVSASKHAIGDARRAPPWAAALRPSTASASERKYHQVMLLARTVEDEQPYGRWLAASRLQMRRNLWRHPSPRVTSLEAAPSRLRRPNRTVASDAANVIWAEIFNWHRSSSCAVVEWCCCCCGDGEAIATRSWGDDVRRCTTTRHETESSTKAPHLKHKLPDVANLTAALRTLMYSFVTWLSGVWLSYCLPVFLYVCLAVCYLATTCKTACWSDLCKSFLD